MINTYFNKSTIAIVLAAAFAGLSGCAGGGGGSKGDYESIFPVNPSIPPETTPKPDIPADNINTQDPRLSYNSSFIRQGIDVVEAQGYTGKGVKVGVLDTGYVGGNGAKVVDQKRYHGLVEEKLPDGTYQLRTDKDFAFHGTAVADLIGGRSPDGIDNLQYPGGIAKDAQIYSGDIGVTSTYVSQNAIAAGINDMSNKGVSIVNLSSNTPSLTEGSAPSISLAFQKEATDAINNGMLILIANGNENKDNPGSSSYLPMADPQTQKGFITVGGVDLESNGSPITSATPVFDGGYNRCGSAAQWCMVATGTNPVGDGYFSGTSSATPLVTGVASQIKQKYPWADNDFLRTSLLTTAEDIGFAGVDETFGWGLLKADKAINGPASLPFGQLTLDVSAGSYALSNDISGQYGFDKTGAGTIELTGNNTFTGKSFVSGGVYKVTGSVINSTTVAAGGTLSGAGTFGDVNNAGGLVSAVQSDFTVSGNYSQGPTGTLDVAYGNKLDVSGQASLDGRIQVDKTANGYVSKDNPSETVVKAGNIIGTFQNVDIGDILLNSSLSYSPTEVTLSASRVDVTKAATAAAASGHKVSATGAVNLENLYSALDSGVNADISAKTMATTIQHETKTQAQLASTTKSMDATVYGNAVTTSQLQIEQANKVFSEQMAQDGAFAVYEGGRGELNSAEATTDLDSILVGNVFRLNKDWSVGLTFVAQNALLEQMYGKSKTDMFGAMVALQYGRNDNGFLRGTIGAHRLESETKRSVSVADIKHGVSSDMDGTILTADITVGRKFALYSTDTSVFTIQPSAGITYLFNRLGSFEEDSANGFGYDFDKSTFKRTTTHAELDMEYRFKAGTMPVSLNGYAGVSHDLSGIKHSFEGTFANSGVAIRTSDSSFPKSRGNVGLGFKLDLTDMISLGSRYDRQFGSGYHQNYFNGNLAIRW